LRKKAEDLIGPLEEGLRYFSDLGAEFAFPLPSETIDKESVLHPMEKKILRCRLCPLSQGRTKAVPGEGNYDTPLMFVGEAPGADEDLQGRPFVGKAGQLLTKIIEAMKFRREDVYITNVVKCRPPQNRTPLRPEIDACKPYLQTQIRVIAPRVIVTLGKVATDWFIASSAGMTSLRGDFHDYGKILVMPTFHPSYVIRNEGDKKIKKLVWQDMQRVMIALGKK
jgi:uracil-DNA glycosylase family 4